MKAKLIALSLVLASAAPALEVVCKNPGAALQPAATFSGLFENTINLVLDVPHGPATTLIYRMECYRFPGPAGHAYTCPEVRTEGQEWIVKLESRGSSDLEASFVPASGFGATITAPCVRK